MIELIPETIQIIKISEREDIVDYNEANNQVYFFEKKDVTTTDSGYSYLQGDTSFTDIEESEIIDAVDAMSSDECVIILQSEANNKKMFDCFYS